MTADDEALLARLLQQERDLQFIRFTNDDALDLGLKLIDAARKRGVAIMVDIRRHGHTLFVHAMAGTSPDNAEWIRRKVNVVNRFAHSSFYQGQRYRAQGSSFEAHTGLDPQEFAAHGGCFPVLVRDVGMVGSITVSGLPQAEDHALLVEVLTAFLAQR